MSYAMTNIGMMGYHRYLITEPQPQQWISRNQTWNIILSLCCNKPLWLTHQLGTKYLTNDISSRGAVAQSVERLKDPSLVELYWRGFESRERPSFLFYYAGA